MAQKRSVSIMIILLLLLLPTFSLAAGHGGHGGDEDKGPAILLITFGTSIPKAQAAFDNIQKRVVQAFPDTEIRWAYTSSIIRAKLAKQGKQLDSPEVALAKLMDDGYSQVAVQSLHMIPGAEFHEIYGNAKLFEQMAGGFDKVIVSYPLLAGNDNLDKVVSTLMSEIIPKERKAGEAVVLMGHGTHHSSDAIYSAMMYKFQKKDSNIYMGTVEGHPDFEEIKEMMIKNSVKKAYLIPFMTVAGDHALNDMAGEEDDSWKSMLTAAGIECVPVLKGLAESDVMVDIWIENLKKAMAHLKE